jgi:HK97 family phage prohead protease
MSVIDTVREGRQMRVSPAKLRVTQARSAGGQIKISGTAIVFDTWSDIGGGIMERIARGAVDQAYARAQKLPLLRGHDMNMLLARRGAGLETWVDASGLHFKATVADTTYARDLVALLEADSRGGGCSFGFTIADEQFEQRDGVPHFTVTELGELFEISCGVTVPAYDTTSVSLDRSVDARAALRAAIDRRIGSIRDRSVYDLDGAGDCEHSKYRDLVVAVEAQRSMNLWNEHNRPPRTNLAEFGGMPTAASRMHGGVEDALRRLRTLGPKFRDVGSGALSGLIDTTTGVTDFVGATFHVSAQDQLALAAAMQRIPLSRGFILPSTAAVPGGFVSTGGVVVAQSAENASETFTSIAETATALKPATLTGGVRISRQLLDRAIGADAAIEKELGAALGAVIETQTWNGSGSSGQLLGILNVAGATAATYVDASPTAAEALVAILKLRSLTGTAAGGKPTQLAMHLRRSSWLLAGEDSNNAWAMITNALAPLNLIESAGTPTTLGAGTEDAVVMFSPDAVALAMTDPEIIVDTDSHGPQSIGISVLQYAALIARLPVAIGVLTGSGLAAVSGY